MPPEPGPSRSSSVEGSRCSSSERSRTSISERLGSLFPNALQQSSSSPTHADHRITARRASSARNMKPLRVPVLSSPTLTSTTKPQVPIVRWLGGSTSGNADRPATVSGLAHESDEAEGMSTALQQAIDEQIPEQPPPSNMRIAPTTRHNLFRSSSLRGAPLMNSLARSTIPTYCPTSPPEAVSDFTVLASQSPPKRTSIDSLRLLNGRGVHTSASQDERSAPPSSPRSWFRWENKQSMEQTAEVVDRADTVKAEQEHMRRKYLSPKNPVVFCHGLLGFDSITLGTSFAPLQVSHWRGIKEVIEANGTEVLITRVPATSSINERAKVLEQKVSDVYPGREVHLIGHSMGGLDCRYLTTHLRHSKFKVRSITTIATPHRGSTFADHFLQTIGPERLPSILSVLDLLPNGGGDGKAFESLTIESMRRFNEETPDVEGVQYFSWGATYEPGLLDTWRWPHSVILEKEGPNDGLVSVESSKWGTYLGTLDNVSHLDLVGWINTARYKWAELTGREIAFKPATFYLGIVDHLARIVEGQVLEDTPTTEEQDYRPPASPPGT